MISLISENGFENFGHIWNEKNSDKVSFSLAGNDVIAISSQADFQWNDKNDKNVKADTWSSTKIFCVLGLRCSPTTVCDLLSFYCWPEITSKRFRHYIEAIQVISDEGFWKGDSDCILVLHFNSVYIEHGFRNELLLFTGNDIIAILAQGGAPGNM